MKLIDMKCSKESEMEEGEPDEKEDDDEESYPYGLSLRLENDELDKLKMALPSPGDMFRIEAIAQVTSVHKSVSSSNEGDRAVTLQITQMSLTRKTA